MDEQPLPSVPSVIPSPDLPQPSLPPSKEAFDSTQAPPVVLVKTAVVPDAVAGEAGSLAPFGTRIVAALIDALVAVGLQIVVAQILPHFASHISWLVGFGYLVTRDSLPFLNGQSVGKKAMKLRVVTLEGKSLIGNWEPALIRNAVLAIPFFAFIEWIVLLTREDKPERGRRLGDEWAKTQVILAPEAPSAAPPA